MGNRRVLILSLVLLGLAVPPLAHAGDPGAQVLAFGNAGLEVGDSSVFTGAVAEVAYDPAQDLIWFTSKGSLHVLDLRKAGSKPVLIAKKMPEGGFAIRGRSNADSGNTHSGVYPVLTLGKKHKVGTGEGAYAGDSEDEDRTAKKAIKKIKITGTKWLKAQAKRTPHEVAAFSDEVVGTVKLPDAIATCEDETMCGRARGFGGTRLQLVLTEHSCANWKAGAPLTGDRCHTGCVLYDPASATFASTLEAGTWGLDPTAYDCSGYEFAPDGRSYVYLNMKCEVNKTVSCAASEDWTYVAWVADDIAAGYGLQVGAVVADSPEVERAIGDLTALRDRACKCKDQKCVEGIEKGLEAMASKYQDTKASDEQTERATKIAEEMAACMVKVP